MIFALYLAWAILLIRGAKDPQAAASLFDSGVLANLMHGSLMVYQAFAYPTNTPTCGPIFHCFSPSVA